MSGFVIALYPIAKLCTSERKLFFLMVGRGGGGRQCILMHKGGIFMLVANNVMVGVPCTMYVGVVIISGSSLLLGTNVK